MYCWVRVLELAEEKKGSPPIEGKDLQKICSSIPKIDLFIHTTEKFGNVLLILLSKELKRESSIKLLR